MPIKSVVVAIINENISKASDTFIFQEGTLYYKIVCEREAIIVHLWVRETPTVYLFFPLMPASLGPNWKGEKLPLASGRKKVKREGRV